MLNETFNEYLSEFKKLSVTEKRNEIIDNLKEFIAIFDSLASREGIKINYLKSNEIKDLYDKNVSEDDYLEGIFVYFEVAKSILGQYLRNQKQ